MAGEVVTVEPRRLTPTERLHEVTMAVLNRQPAAPEHDVSLERRAKGEVYIAVKTRGTDLAETGTACEVEFERLCRAYPHGNGGAE